MARAKKELTLEQTVILKEKELIKALDKLIIEEEEYVDTLRRMIKTSETPSVLATLILDSGQNIARLRAKKQFLLNF